MKLNPIKAVLAAALGAAVLSASPASAALNYTTDDLFLGFRQTGNTTTDYIVNIGQASIYRDATGTISLNLPGLLTDLNKAFNNTLAGISWGVVGTTQNTPATAPDNFVRLLYASQPQGLTPTASSGQATPAGGIIGMKNYWQASTGTAATAPYAGTLGSVDNSAFGDPGNSQSWSAKVDSSFGSPAVLGSIEDAISSKIDLFRIPQTANGATTNEGFFGFDSNTGVVSFTSTTLAAVPEPSTMLFGVALVAALAIRRRLVATA